MGLRSQIWPKCCSHAKQVSAWKPLQHTRYRLLPGLHIIQRKYFPQTIPLTMHAKHNSTQRYLHYKHHKCTSVCQICLLEGFHDHSSIPAQGLLKYLQKGNNTFRGQDIQRLSRPYSFSNYNHLKLISEILERSFLSSFQHLWRYLGFFPSA